VKEKREERKDSDPSVLRPQRAKRESRRERERGKETEGEKGKKKHLVARKKFS